MAIIFLLIYLLLPFSADAARRFTDVEGPTGHQSCVTAEDEDQNGFENDCSSNSSISDEGSYYAGAFDSALMVGGYATVIDPSFVQGSYVAKPAGTPFWQGKIRFAGTVDAGTYYLDLYSSTPTGDASICISSSGLNPFTVNNGTTCTWIPANTNPNWTNQSVGTLKTAGANINFGNRVSGGDRFSFVHAGGVLYLDFLTSADIRLSCFTLTTDTDPLFASGCPSETPTTITPSYTMLKSSGAPANCAAMANANVLPLNGTNSGYTDTAPTIRFLHESSTIYMCATKPDNDLRTTSSTADVLENNSDRIEVSIRNSTLTTARDENTYKFSVNLLNGKYSANYPGNVANTAQSLSEACTVSLTGDLNTTADDTSSQWFCSFTIGTITDDTFANMEVMVFDSDGTGNTYRLAFGAGINNPATWHPILFSSTTAAGGDATAPVVTAFTCANNITATSMTCTFAVDEDGLATIQNSSNTDLTQQTATVNGIGSIVVAGLTSNTSYTLHARMCDAVPNCSTSSTDTQVTLASSATHYAGPTLTGAGNCTSPANRGTIGLCMSLSTFGPGSILELADGTTYTDATDMIIPPAGKNGTVGAPITVRAANDGEVWINGGGTLTPLDLTDNSYWVIEGIDFSDSPSYVVRVRQASQNVTLRRICAWDGSISSNVTVIHIVGAGTLIEDWCAFGTARKTFSFSQAGIVATPMIMRRGWAMFNGTNAGSGGNPLTYSMNYQSLPNICENCIGTYDKKTGTVTEASSGIFDLGRLDSITKGFGTAASRCSNSGYYGSIAYLKSGQTIGGWISTAFIGKSNDCFEYKDLVVAFDPNRVNARQLLCQAFDPTTTTDGGNAVGGQRKFTNVTQIKNASSTADVLITDQPNGCTITNQQVYTTIANAISGGASPWQATSGTGARVCFEYLNKTLTSTKLWPWRMDSGGGSGGTTNRIRQALTRAGYSANSELGGTNFGVTEQMEAILGTIPAACRR